MEVSLSEGNFSPSGRNTLWHVLLDTIADSPVLFKIINIIVSSNPIPHMAVPFILVLIHFQEQCQARESKRVKTSTKAFKSQMKS